MRGGRRILGWAMLVLSSQVAGTTAFADGWSGGWHGGGWAYGGYRWETANIPTPPYFAVHPPVYYSEPVRLPYGISPLPRLPSPGYDVRPSTAADVAPAAPRLPGVMIVNPFVVDRDGKGSAAPPKPASGKRRIRT
jgi:hypothetical protein